VEEANLLLSLEEGNKEVHADGWVEGADESTVEVEGAESTEAEG